MDGPGQRRRRPGPCLGRARRRSHLGGHHRRGAGLRLRPAPHRPGDARQRPPRRPARRLRRLGDPRTEDAAGDDQRGGRDAGAGPRARCATDAAFFSKDPYSINFGRGSAEIAYRPIAFDGTIDATDLVIGLNFGEPGFAIEPEPIEPLETIPEACDPDTGECEIGFDGLPEVELFDVEAGTWRRLPHLDGGSRYTVSGPARFVDPSTGTVLVRFVNENSDGVGFSLDLAITGSLR